MKKIELGPGRTKYIIEEPCAVWDIPITRSDDIIMPYRKGGSLIISGGDRKDGIAKFSFGEAISGYAVVVSTA